MIGDDFRLCFVDRDQTAYFTSKPLAEAGDETWDGPLEKANPPCDADGRLIACVVDHDGFVHRADMTCVLDWSANLTNALGGAWCRVPDGEPITAGTTFREFRRLIRETGGKVWVDADLVDMET